jgi:hypothetical protein
MRNLFASEATISFSKTELYGVVSLYVCLTFVSKKEMPFLSTTQNTVNYYVRVASIYCGTEFSLIGMLGVYWTL